jgi:microcystin degradation protein MlrC
MPFKVLTAEMSHETNSFSRQETDEEAFRNRYVLMGAEAVAERGQANTELAGFPRHRSSTWLAHQSCAQRSRGPKRQG